MNVREFILSDKVFSKCSTQEQASIMNELDYHDELQEEYGTLILELKQEREKNDQLLMKYRQLEHTHFNLKEKIEKAYRNQPW